MLIVLLELEFVPCFYNISVLNFDQLAANVVNVECVVHLLFIYKVIIYSFQLQRDYKIM